MRRKLWNALAGLSLLLCLAALALWLHSWWYVITLCIPTSEVSKDVVMPTHITNRLGGQPITWVFEMTSAGGRLGVAHYSLVPPLGPVLDIQSRDRRDTLMSAREWGEEPDFAFAGFEVWTPAHSCIAPLWAIAILFAALPAWRIYKHYSTPRGPTACRACGYDLRATPGRCPECGKQVELVAR